MSNLNEIIFDLAPPTILRRLSKRRFVAEGLAGESLDYQRFVVLGHQRTGSTLVSSTLSSHGGAHCFSEIFNTGDIQFFTAGLPNASALLKAYRRRAPLEFLRDFVYGGYRPELRAIGFKLFPEHIRQDYLAPVIEHLRAEPGIRFIHIYRANHLKVLLSLRLAQLTGAWSSSGGGHDANAQVQISLSELERFSERRAEDEDFLRSLFGDKEYVEFEYTKLTADLEASFDAILDFLGLARCDIQPKLKKQTTGSLRDRIDNYDELLSMCQGTELERFFEE